MNISHDAIPDVAALARAALRLLEEIDENRMFELWERASEGSRAAVMAQDVARAVAAFRQAQGALVSRDWVGARREPHEPQYLRLMFRSRFEAWAGEELITLECESDGIWRLSGYGVFPAEVPVTV